jgi:formate-dependent nitrite reductase cytochrome c552 subunit
MADDDDLGLLFRGRTKVKRILVVLTVAVFAVLLTGSAWAQDEKAPGKADTLKWAEGKFHYVGETKCKTCHKAQYESWGKSKHANAWAALKPEEQAKPECAECHITGKTESDSLLVNVGCESCHGPGSEYKSMKAMKDHALASAAGLLPINEATCVRCHNKKSPNFKPFNYAEALKAGVHDHPAKETK